MYGSIVEPGSSVSLKDFKTRISNNLTKEKGATELAEYVSELGMLQKLLFSAGSHALLVVFQGMDTSGKDSTIREVFTDVNPAGLIQTAFKVPSATELSHDFLWRIHQKTPEFGQIGVFNRSHYEDVVVVRVHELAPKEVWTARYEQINHFESLLAANRTIIAKFFLHISKEQQEERLLAREQDLTDAWKLSVNDWKERAYWDDYQVAYADAIEKCSTEIAPWIVIPADQKWLRNLAVAEALVKQLRPYAKVWEKQLHDEARTQLAALEQARTEGIIPRPGEAYDEVEID